jgi:hypothetical protein
MASWAQIVAAEPEFAAAVRGIFDARKHKTMATLRKDGSPRISGMERQFEDGELWLGMMAGSLKAADVQRDPRVAIHAASDDPPPDNQSAWLGDAKLAGRALDAGPLTGEGQPPGQRFHLDITEVVLTRLGDPADHLLIESWHEGRGLSRVKRY